MLKCDSDESVGIVPGAVEDASTLGMIFYLTSFMRCVRIKKLPLIFSL